MSRDLGEAASGALDADVIEATMLRLAGERGAEKTICPSEIARALGGPEPDAWRPLMDPVRRAAVRLAGRGEVAILQKGAPVTDAETFEGIYRIGLPRATGA